LQFDTQHFVSGDIQAVILSLVFAHKYVSFPSKKKGKKRGKEKKTVQ